MAAYYNEIDPYAAQWLRNLIQAGHIAPGFVDERSIEDVQPDDLREFVQVHCFAGIGVWSYALRRAGWPDDRRIWTGSAPCQPFSAAGQGAAFADERHLWPAFYHLIGQCDPAIVIGEQVASRDADAWIDLVQADMEALGHAFGAVAFPSAGVGAPHIRDRTYWVAHGNSHRRSALPLDRCNDAQCDAEPCGEPRRVADDDDAGSQRRHESGQRTGTQLATVERGSQAGRLEYSRHDHDASQSQTASAGQPQTDRSTDLAGGPGVSFGRVGDAERSGIRGESRSLDSAQASFRDRQHVHDSGATGHAGDTGPVNGLWRDADWLFCRDGKWRPVEPGTFPLAYGAPARVGRGSANWYAPAGSEGFGHRAGRLKGYGNAINAEAAVAFIKSLP